MPRVSLRAIHQGESSGQPQAISYLFSAPFLPEVPLYPPLSLASSPGGLTALHCLLSLGKQCLCLHTQQIAPFSHLPPSLMETSHSPLSLLPQGSEWLSTRGQPSLHNSGPSSFRTFSPIIPFKVKRLTGKYGGLYLRNISPDSYAWDRCGADPSR